MCIILHFLLLSDSRYNAKIILQLAGPITIDLCIFCHCWHAKCDNYTRNSWLSIVALHILHNNKCENTWDILARVILYPDFGMTLLSARGAGAALARPPSGVSRRGRHRWISQHSTRHLSGYTTISSSSFVFTNFSPLISSLAIAGLTTISLNMSLSVIGFSCCY